MSFPSKNDSQAYTASSAAAALFWDRYGTEARHANAGKLTEQIRRGDAQITAFPWRIVLETGNVCNLRCCVAGRSDVTGGLPKGILSLEDAKRFLEQLFPYLVQVNLFNWGEPLLNPELPQIVGLLSRHNVGSQVHTNMNKLSKDFAQRLLDQGLDLLVASIDGVTQETYGTFRKGGDCAKALGNLRKLVRLRNDYPESNLVIVWRFLCFDHNIHEVEAARELAQEIGVDNFVGVTGNSPRQPRRPANDAIRKERQDEGTDDYYPVCTELFDFPVIHWDGSLLPCCHVYGSEWLWDEVGQHTWHEAFNTPAFQAARRALSNADNPKNKCRICKQAALSTTDPMSM